jgi:hypothetical protein
MFKVKINAGQSDLSNEQQWVLVRNQRQTNHTEQAGCGEQQ